jgi:hypothetical protein
MLPAGNLGVSLLARFLVDVHISSNDLVQFFDINYFPLSELNHLHETEKRGDNGRPLDDMFLLSLGGSFIKA